MSQNRGFENKQAQGREKAVTVTESGDKVGLDVTLVGGGSAGTGSGTELEGANNLASGSLLYGLEWKAFEKQASPNAVTDVYHYFSDAAKTNLITIITIIHADDSKTEVIETTRQDQ